MELWKRQQAHIVTNTHTLDEGNDERRTWNRTAAADFSTLTNIFIFGIHHWHLFEQFVRSSRSFSPTIWRQSIQRKCLFALFPFCHKFVAKNEQRKKIKEKQTLTIVVGVAVGNVIIINDFVRQKCSSAKRKESRTRWKRKKKVFPKDCVKKKLFVNFGRTREAIITFKSLRFSFALARARSPRARFRLFCAPCRQCYCPLKYDSFFSLPVLSASFARQCSSSLIA